MCEVIIGAVIGGAISLATTLFVQWWQNSLQLKNREQLILSEIYALLSNLYTEFLKRAVENSSDDVISNGKGENKIYMISTELNNLALRLTSRCHRVIACIFRL